MTSATPESETEKFYAAMGRAISAWAKAEEQLYLIADLILKTSAQLTSIVFYRTPTIDSRLTLVDDLIRTVYPPPKNGEKELPGYKVWKALQSDMKEALSVRNQLAHHPVGGAVDIYLSSDGIAFSGSKPAIYMSEAELARNPKKQYKVLGTAEIQQHFEAVIDFSKRLRAFQDDELITQLQSRGGQ